MTGKKLWDDMEDEFEDTDEFVFGDGSTLIEDSPDHEYDFEEPDDEVVDYMGGNNFDDILAADWEE